MKVILPSAGYATRMYPLTLDKPKALLEVNGKPIIEYIIDKVCLIDEVDRIFVVTNDKFYEKFLEWSRVFSCNVSLRVLNDGTKSNDKRLGTIGDVNFVLEREEIDDDFIVINSDNLFSFNLVKMYEDFRSRGANVVSIYDVGNLEIARRMGALRVDDNRKIIFFKEKDPNVQSSLCSIGIYFFAGYVSKLIKRYLDDGNFGDRPGDFIEWLYKRREVYGHIFDPGNNKWFDIGSLESYEEAKRVWKD